MNLKERLQYWAQNEEMIDQHFTAHGRDCNEAADEIERLQSQVSQLEASNAKLKMHAEAMATEYDASGRYISLVKAISAYRADFPRNDK